MNKFTKIKSEKNNECEHVSSPQGNRNEYIRLVNSRVGLHVRY